MSITIEVTPAGELVVEQVAPVVEVSVPTRPAIQVSAVGAPGRQGEPGEQGDPGPPGADSTVPGPPGADYDPAEADLRYVNLTGDTMTGALVLQSGAVSLPLSTTFDGQAHLGDVTAAGTVKRVVIPYHGQGGGYGVKGVEILNVEGASLVLHALGNGVLYLTKQDGSAGGLTIEAIRSPYDNSRLANTNGGVWSLADSGGGAGVSLGVAALPTAGIKLEVGGAGKFSGAVLLPGDPTQPLHAATKQYVDGKAPTLPPETDAKGNTSYGASALVNGANMTESNAFGQMALAAATAGNGTAVGTGALGSVASAYESTAVGNYAGYTATGTSLTLLGHGAGYYPVGLGAASQVTLVGVFACSTAPGAGIKGAALGHSTKVNNYATALGSSAEARGANSTAVGYGAIATLANQIMLGTATERVDVPGTLHVKDQPINPWVSITQAAYDALPVKDPNTLYVVAG